MLDIIYTTTRK